MGMIFQQHRPLAAQLAALPKVPAHNPLQFQGDLHGITFIQDNRRARHYFAIVHLEVPRRSLARCPLCRRRFVDVQRHLMRRHAV
jgi:hypothetical protein